MRTMLSSFLGQKQETIHTAFFNCSHSNRHFHEAQVQFNICATDISTATAASCKGIHFNYPRDTDAFTPGHLNRSAEPSSQQEQQQQSGGQPIDVIDGQNAGHSRPLKFILTPTKHFNLHQLPLLQMQKDKTTYQDLQVSSETYPQC